MLSQATIGSHPLPPSSAYPRPLHVVQVSLDGELLRAERSAEPRARQLEYARALTARRPGSQMTILVLTRDRALRGFVAENLRVVPVAGALRGALALLDELRATYVARPIDVVTTQRVFGEAWLVLAFAWWHGIRVVGQIHADIFSPEGAPWPFASRPFQRPWGWLVTRGLRGFARLRVVAEDTKQAIVRGGLHHRVEVSPVPVAHLGMVARDRPNPGAARSRRVLFVGRLSRQKDLAAWLAVAARVARAEPRAVFEIVGDGPERPELERLAKSLGITERVGFTGFVPNARLAEIYASASVLLLTSRYEGFGRVAVEAYAHGTPVVSTAVVGVTEIVDDGATGFIRDRGDLDGLAECVVRLLRDDRLRQQMGERGRIRVTERFEPRRLRDRWVGILISAARDDLGALRLPLRRTVSRWRRIAASPHSTLRALEYEAIAGLSLRGRTLDLGGGRRADYLPLLDIDGVVESVNVDPEMQPTHVADLNERLPLASETYDNVVSFNTFEHVRRDELAIAEAIRVLRTGGRFHLVVPFLYRFHGSPDDFHRHTWQWWQATMVGLGIDVDRLSIDPLVWSRAVSGYSFFGSSRIGRLVRRLILFPAVVRDLFVTRDLRLRDTGGNRRLIDYALGFHIHGEK
jgi:glycosyltransferase involved in cell wall biosynthesis